MPWIEFISRFDWSPPQLGRRWTVAYRIGDVRLVTTPCARAAIAAGKAIRTHKRPASRRVETAEARP